MLKKRSVSVCTDMVYLYFRWVNHKNLKVSCLAWSNAMLDDVSEDKTSLKTIRGLRIVSALRSNSGLLGAKNFKV